MYVALRAVRGRQIQQEVEEHQYKTGQFFLRFTAEKEVNKAPTEKGIRLRLLKRVCACESRLFLSLYLYLSLCVCVFLKHIASAVVYTLAAAKLRLGRGRFTCPLLQQPVRSASLLICLFCLFHACISCVGEEERALGAFAFAVCGGSGHPVSCGAYGTR